MNTAAIAAFPMTQPLASGAGLPAPPDHIRLWWLGQAGFLVRFGETLLAVDPYVSDSDHRLMPSPWQPDEPIGLRAVLCSHNHSDHLDIPALPAIAGANPDCRFVVPAAERDVALKSGVQTDRIIGVNAGAILDIADGVKIHVLASAHETLSMNARGEHHFLGFVLEINGRRLYHSGDCVPYPGLADQLRDLHIDLALLPVNGRDAERLSRNIIGNFTFDEAATLCLQAGIPTLIPHHIDMFAGNTVPRAGLLKAAASLQDRLHCILPEMERRYEIR